MQIFPAIDLSGGQVVRYAGGCRENAIVWNRVWSDQGGRYEMRIAYLPAANRGLEVVVNGKSVQVPLSAEGVVTLPVVLRPGDNTVEMTCRTQWAPDIDQFTLKRTGNVE